MQEITGKILRDETIEYGDYDPMREKYQYNVTFKAIERADGKVIVTVIEDGKEVIYCDYLYPNEVDTFFDGIHVNSWMYQSNRVYRLDVSFTVKEKIEDVEYDIHFGLDKWSVDDIDELYETRDEVIELLRER